MPTNTSPQDPRSQISHSQTRDLFISHFLSTWNARTYEFAAVIFTAAAFPDTLLFSSIRGIVTTLASICFSSSIGHWIDHAPSRLKTLVTTITANRLSVVSASIFWYFLSSNEVNSDPPIGFRQLDLISQGEKSSSQTPKLAKGLMFAAILALGVVEKLSGSANMISMERDWVVTICATTDGAVLTKLNSTMRRIDLICKLVAPILISVVISTAGSIKVGVLVVGGMSALSWGIEYWCAKRVWNANANLRIPKSMPSDDRGIETAEEVLHTAQSGNSYSSFLAKKVQWFRQYFENFSNYFSTEVWIPSLSLTLLHLSTLSYGATFITFLLNYGFSLNLITIARAVGSVVEISSTLVTPFGVKRLSKARCDPPVPIDEETDAELPLLESDEEISVPSNAETQIGLSRLGLWGLTWQFVNLIPVLFALWTLSSTPSPPNLTPHPIFSKFTPSSTFHPAIPTTITLFTFLSLSRLGLWIFDLTTQQLTQTLVPTHQRSSFAGVENSFISGFELVQGIAGILFSRPEDFKWLGVGSFGAVGISLFLYVGWVWRRRGHLVHWERIGGACECVKVGGR